ncbi:MAG: indole-3-glycerol phosphate synthase TrpC [Thermodesulfobacteriota bacterium]|nr:indole-3-glycerol phosphate synthase TrpC [Thermodesulfobacteriota bacterium]
MNILQKIVEQKKQEIAEAKKRLPESVLRKKAFYLKRRRSFLKRLSKPESSGVNVIAEIKRASPSKGMIRPDLDVAKYALDCELGGASALSALTDRCYFKGSIEDLKKARKTTSLPVLRKDFIISSYQIYESSVMEADAVLLIVRILSRQQLKDYINLCAKIGMDVLVETHSREEIEAAAMAGAKLIGINNRNLSSFKTDVENAVRLASLLSPVQIAVAESGIKSRENIEKLMDAGIRNFLIGESLVMAPDAKAFLRALLRDRL